MLFSFPLRVAALALALPLVLSSCSKQNDPVSSLSVTEATQSVRVLANGRLAFSNNDAYNATFQKLLTMNSSELDQWEKQVGFHSLRTADPATQPAAIALRQGFGFPAECATLISPTGEYQIGDRISWFHEGFRYIAHSEQELAALKQNPTLATEKYSAGVQKPAAASTAPSRSTSGGTIVPTSTTDVTTRTWTNYSGGPNETNGDGRYNSDADEFLLNGQNFSYRKINFESVMFVQNVTDQVNHQDGYNVYYTGVYLNEYYETLNRSRGTWYRNDDYSRVTSYSLGGTYSVQGSNFYTQQYLYGYRSASYSGKGQAITGNINKSINQYYHNSGDYQTTIASAYLYSYHSEGDSGFTWTFDVQGSYSSYVDAGNPNFYTNNSHTISGNLW